ncbi:MAG: hypothetical protein ACO3SP_07475, partial [Ilumatobacteraceae bacterium]
SLSTGRRPFEAKLATALAADIQTKPPVPPRQLDPEIPPRLGHYVAVPRDAPDLRRHWHRACWDRRI